MRILFFGRLGDRLGRELEIEPPDGDLTIGELRRMLCLRNVAFNEMLRDPGVKACVDRIVVRDDALVRGGQEIAFIPPLSGG